MAALTFDKDILRKDGDIYAHPMDTVTVFQGALVNLKASGYLDNCSDGATGAKFAGVAVERINNQAGAYYATGTGVPGNVGAATQGNNSVRMRVYKRGNFLLSGSGFAMTDVGSKVYASDNATVTKTSAAGRACVGIIIDVESATQVWVAIDSQVNQPVATS